MNSQIKVVSIKTLSRTRPTYFRYVTLTMTYLSFYFGELVLIFKRCIQLSSWPWGSKKEKQNISICTLRTSKKLKMCFLLWIVLLRLYWKAVLFNYIKATVYIYWLYLILTKKNLISNINILFYSSCILHTFRISILELPAVINCSNCKTTVMVASELCTIGLTKQRTNVFTILPCGFSCSCYVRIAETQKLCL